MISGYIFGVLVFLLQSKSMKYIKGNQQAPPPFQWIWKSHCQDKHKVFFWLLLNDRLNTRNLLRRKQFNAPNVECVMYRHGVEETIKHLFLECEFAQFCWAFVFHLRPLYVSFRVDRRW
jgi:hypothetical protein